MLKVAKVCSMIFKPQIDVWYMSREHKFQTFGSQNGKKGQLWANRNFPM